MADYLLIGLLYIAMVYFCLIRKAEKRRLWWREYWWCVLWPFLPIRIGYMMFKRGKVGDDA